MSMPGPQGGALPNGMMDPQRLQMLLQIMQQRQQGGGQMPPGMTR